MRKKSTHEKTCTLCGHNHYDAFAFKGGQVCEDCLQELRLFPTDENTASDEE